MSLIRRAKGTGKWIPDSFISNQWSELESHLGLTFMLTVFGYGAPKSDKSAIELMKKAWGEIEKRSLEQIEITQFNEEVHKRGGG